MTFSEQDTTNDGFLGGQLTIRQPRNGYRAATDPVFLAASVPAQHGQSVLELGCGVGVASLCLAVAVGLLLVSMPDLGQLLDGRVRGSVTIMDRSGDVFARRGDQFGGFVTATDTATDTEIWVQKVYDIVYGDKSPQKDDLFITQLKLLDDGKGLQITDQNGRVHRMDLESRVVTLIVEPVAGSPRPHPDKPPTTKPKSLLQRLLGR